MKVTSYSPEFTFDDVLLLPNKSDYQIEQEQEKIILKTKISRHITLDIPIVSSPMPNVTGKEMAIALGKMGGLGFVHSLQNFDEQVDQIAQIKKHNVKVAASIGNISEQGKLSETGIKQVGNLLKAGASLISIETAHAYNSQTINFVKRLKREYNNIEISIALVVTDEATEDLIKAGADSIRVGIGGGSHCTTRLVTGIGRPQLSAVNECYKIAKKYNVPIISDTGIKYSGDIAKALAFGADTVMIGGLLSGTDKSPGKIIKRDGKLYKYSWGICTETAMSYQSPRESYLKKIKREIKERIKNIVGLKNFPTENYIFEEGVGGLIPYKGSTVGVINKLIAGMRRSMWYLGSKNIKELRKKTRVVFVSKATLEENLPRI